MKNNRKSAIILIILMISMTSAGESAKKWVSGDVHIHTDGCSDTTSYMPAEIVQFMSKEKLNIGSLLVFAAGLSSKIQRSLITGNDHPASRSDHIIHYDAEISAVHGDQGGHLILLGLPSMASLDIPGSPLSTAAMDDNIDENKSHRSGLPIIDWIFDKKLPILVGMAHTQVWWPLHIKKPPPGADTFPLEAPIHIARNRLHFLETNDAVGISRKSDDPFTKLWAKLLNCGFRIPIAGGSDFSCMDENVGGVRTYVLSENPMSYKAFLDGIRNGRTVVSGRIGEWMNLTVNNVGLGGEVRIKSGEGVNVVVDAYMPQAGDLEILVNGKVLRRYTLSKGNPKINTTLKLDKSSWIAVRTPHALSSAIYVLLDEKPIRVSAEDAQYFIQFIDYLINLVKTGKTDMGKDKDRALKAYQEARAVFQKRYEEARAMNPIKDLKATNSDIQSIALEWTVPESNTSSYPLVI